MEGIITLGPIFSTLLTLGKTVFPKIQCYPRPVMCWHPDMTFWGLSSNLGVTKNLGPEVQYPGEP